MSQRTKLMTSLNLTETTLFHPSLHRAEAPIELFSSAAWSYLTEPGDEFAGMARQALGSAQSLALLVSGAKPESWLSHLSDLGYSDVAIERFGAVSDVLRDSLARWNQRLSLSGVLESLDIATRLGVDLVDPSDENWPSQLSSLKFASPALLWVRGSLEVVRDSETSWAVVGCRTPSNYGREATSNLVQGLAESGISVVSGGAFGIDAIAHHSALICQTPTIAVMAGGVDRLYPRTNEHLLNKIIDRGAVVSEVAIGVAPTKWRFLQRNRIIAALAGGTVIVEAGYRSGAINTANHALTLARPVAAIPGSVFSPQSAGCNRLISDGRAQLVTNASDLLSIFPGEFILDEITVEAMSPTEIRTYDAIGFGTLVIEEICRTAGLTLSEASQGLGSLLMKGKVLQRGAGYLRA